MRAYGKFFSSKHQISRKFENNTNKNEGKNSLQQIRKEGAKLYSLRSERKQDRILVSLVSSQEFYCNSLEFVSVCLYPYCKHSRICPILNPMCI